MYRMGLERAWLVVRLFRDFIFLIETAMMYIHRPYFWTAISKHPDAPHRSEFWHSFLMAYRRY